MINEFLALHLNEAIYGDLIDQFKTLKKIQLLLDLGKGFGTSACQIFSCNHITILVKNVQVTIRSFFRESLF